MQQAYFNIYYNIELMGGCFGDEALRNDNLIIRITKLKHEISLRMQKIRSQALAQEKLLLLEFKKPKSYRALAAQKAYGNSIVMKINKIHIYQVVRCHIQKIIDYKAHVNNLDKAKESLYPSFRTILYSHSILKDQNINYICKEIKQRFRDIGQASDEQIDSQIMRHHKKNEIPTNSMTNEYFLKLVNQENLKLQEINQIGHNIRFGV